VESFVAVVDAGSFSGAATKLALSRALVSKRLAPGR
jgi:DNA-binding transcriptional LysR family regulator